VLSDGKQARTVGLLMLIVGRSGRIPFGVKHKTNDTPFGGGAAQAGECTVRWSVGGMGTRRGDNGQSIVEKDGSKNLQTVKQVLCVEWNERKLRSRCVRKIM
jgi:hypothetical protein